MKKMLSLILVLGLLVCTFGVNSISAEPANQTARILAANPDYRTMVTASGEERILDSNNLVINQIIANVDQVLDVDAYNNGEVDNFFGVDFVEIKPLFEEEWIDSIVDEIGCKFSYLITLPYGSNIDTVMETLRNNEHISAVSQNEYCEIAEDSDYDSETGATGHYDLIGVSYAWEHGFVGSGDTIVAVIDTGAAEHVEFDNNMRFDLGFNTCFQYPHDGFTGGDADDVTPLTATSNHGHKVAGIIGADYGDGGVNGICQNVSIMPILVDGYYDQAQYALSYAIISEVDVINYSWFTRNKVLFDMIEETDILFVVAAGNDSKELVQMTEENLEAERAAEEAGITLDFITSATTNDLPNVIVVGNSTVDDVRCVVYKNDGTIHQGSNYSTTYVDLFAPGYQVKTVNYPTGTTSGSGSSSAAPMVAAAAALIRSHATHLTAAQTKDLILNNVDIVAALEDYCVTSGRLAIDKIVDALYAEDRDEYSKGDVTGDGEITSMDKMFAQRIAYGTMAATADQLYAADVNKDGVVNTTDVDMILGFYYSTCYFPPV